MGPARGRLYTHLGGLTEKASGRKSRECGAAPLPGPFSYPACPDQPAALSQPGPLAETLRKQNREHDVKTAGSALPPTLGLSTCSQALPQVRLLWPRPFPLPPSAVTSPPSPPRPRPLSATATPPPSSNSSSVSWTRPPPHATPPLTCPAPSVSRICPPPLTCPTPPDQPALPSARCPACASGPSRRSPTPGPSRRSRQPAASPPQPHHALDLSPATSLGDRGSAPLLPAVWAGEASAAPERGTCVDPGEARTRAPDLSSPGQAPARRPPARLPLSLGDPPSHPPRPRRRRLAAPLCFGHRGEERCDYRGGLARLKPSSVIFQSDLGMLLLLSASVVASVKWR